MAGGNHSDGNSITKGKENKSRRDWMVKNFGILLKMVANNDDVLNPKVIGS